MEKTYCGKSCMDCDQKEQLSCPGCQNGPGGGFNSSCELAKCCKGKHQESCGVCVFKETCETLPAHQTIPHYLRSKIKADAEKKKAIKKRVPILGKWLVILFWVLIPGIIAGFLAEDIISGSNATFSIVCETLSIVCSFAYALILLGLMKVEDNYKIAGISYLVNIAINVLVTVLSTNGGAETFALFLSIPAIIAKLLAKYCEFNGHRIVLTDIDDDLAEKWEILWSWNIILYGAMIASIIIVFIMPVFGLIVTLGALIGLLVVELKQIAYLHQTANRFKEMNYTNNI